MSNPVTIAQTLLKELGLTPGELIHSDDNMVSFVMNNTFVEVRNAIRTIGRLVWAEGVRPDCNRYGYTAEGRGNIVISQGVSTDTSVEISLLRQDYWPVEDANIEALYNAAQAAAAAGNLDSKLLHLALRKVLRDHGINAVPF